MKRQVVRMETAVSSNRKEHPVSNIHAYADDTVDLNARTVGTTLGALRKAVLTAVGFVGAAIERRQTERFIARLPDHLLHDFGYERDWDGTIRSMRDAA